MKQQSPTGVKRQNRRTPQHFPEYLESRNFQDEIVQLDANLQEFREHTASRQALLTNAISTLAYESFLAGRRAREQTPGFANLSQPQAGERNHLTGVAKTLDTLMKQQFPTTSQPQAEPEPGAKPPRGFFQTLESIREPVRIDLGQPKTCWVCITFLIFVAATLGCGLFILWNSL